ncbi:transcription factor TFIIB [Schizosaccharomyces osmophilus]|uniref:Transcription initiation factor IIB n=1 Tax=Schizosaccharomyces osmophilus TaxID=2545709 RepID=A0AAE9WEH0_9SCHI|nr:transcription factor TFIIB [Schizosaccharomyces osmophilus]WBW73253.1 transcription factor TFIIB [Schizosaccharomyces osmophilus]
MNAPTFAGMPSSMLTVKMMCSECREDPPNLVEEFSSGDTVCGSCGLVLGDRIIDTRSEWRTFSNSDEAGGDPSRVGKVANPLLNGSQLDTAISSADGTGAMLAKAQGRSVQVRGEKNLLTAYKEIGAMCDAISLPKVIADTAKQLYKRVDDHKALKGKSSQSIIAACIYIACRQGKVPRTFMEICTLTNVPKKEIGRVYKTLQRMLTEGGALHNSVDALKGQEYIQSSSTSAEDLMVRFCNRLLLPMVVQSAAAELARRAGQEGTLAGRSPISIAASGIYMISALMGYPKTPKEISEVTGVSDSTIRIAYKLLHAERQKLIDPKWVAKNSTMDAMLPKP